MPSKEGENPFFPPRATPNWLRKISTLYRNERNGDLGERKSHMKVQMRCTDIRDILNESLFYSGCGNDIEPILFFERHIHSFVYCLDPRYNLGYESEFESIKTQLRAENHRKRVNIDFGLDELRRNGWLSGDEWFEQNSNKFRANWSIWENAKDFFSLFFVRCDPETLWRNLFKSNSVCPKVFFFQGWLDSWKGGLGRNEGGAFIVNSEVYCDGFDVFRNSEYKPT